MAKGRIMVVEDEGVVALQIKESLQGMGYEVPLVALTGEEAVARLLETEPDLVLMDIQLKGALSGIDTAQRIRKRLDVPIVYLTAFSGHQEAVATHRAFSLQKRHGNRKWQSRPRLRVYELDEL